VFYRLTFLFTMAIIAATHFAHAANSPAGSNGSEVAQTLRNAKRTIAYIYEPVGNPCKEPISPIATGFFAGFANVVTPDGTAENALFLVTNKHVVEGRKQIIVRIEGPTGSTDCRTLTLEGEGLHQNLFLPKADDVDLAVIATGKTGEKPLGFDYSMLLDEGSMKQLEVEEGTDVVTLGFMLKNPGYKHNYPTLRFGKVASLNDEKWFRGGTHKDEQAFVIDTNLTYGTSGSPVILNPQQIRVSDNGELQHRRVPMLLLGIVKGAPQTTASILAAPALAVNVTQGVAAIEPAASLKMLMRDVANHYIKKGYKISLPDAQLKSGDK
jgi:hypothetical protein